jgi:type I restriction enzyme M protein
VSSPPATYNFSSSGLRQKVDQWFDILWSGGVNNPMDAIEQISYLLFLRLLWEKDDALASLGQRYRRLFAGEWAKRGWGNFVTLGGDDLFDSLREAIENFHNLPGLSSTGRLLFDRATLKIYDRPTLRALVQGIQEIDLEAHDGQDVKGDMYEYLLSKLSVAGRNGQFRTPRHIIDTIVAMVDPHPSRTICDPACGTAGFLISAYRHILRGRTRQAELSRGQIDGQLLSPAEWKYLEERAFTGYDNDANMVKIGILNLYLHQLDRARLEFRNPLTTSLSGSYPGLMFDVILANPPFSGSIQRESILPDLNLPTRATEKLFVKWFMDHLAKGGTAGIIVPEGVIRGDDRAARLIRHKLLTEFDLQAVISLPHYVFKPYATVATCVLVFANASPAGRTWMYRVEADGFSPDGLRTPVDASDLPDLLHQWEIRQGATYRPQPGKHGWTDASAIHAPTLDLTPRTYLAARSSTATYPLRTLGETCTLSRGTQPARESNPRPVPADHNLGRAQDLDQRGLHRTGSLRASGLVDWPWSCQHQATSVRGGSVCSRDHRGRGEGEERDRA